MLWFVFNTNVTVRAAYVRFWVLAIHFPHQANRGNVDIFRYRLTAFWWNYLARSRGWLSVASHKSRGHFSYWGHFAAGAPKDSDVLISDVLPCNIYFTFNTCVNVRTLQQLSACDVLRVRTSLRGLSTGFRVWNVSMSTCLRIEVACVEIATGMVLLQNKRII